MPAAGGASLKSFTLTQERRQNFNPAVAASD
jgi:hypothetical protein